MNSLKLPTEESHGGYAQADSTSNMSGHILEDSRLTVRDLEQSVDQINKIVSTDNTRLAKELQVQKSQAEHARSMLTALFIELNNISSLETLYS